MPKQEVHGGVFTGFDQSSEGINKPFWVLIDDYDGTQYYSWTEQQPYSPGVFLEIPGGRFGTLTQNPVFEANGFAIEVPSYVQIIKGYWDTTYSWVYLVVAGGEGSGTGGGGGGTLCCNGATYSILDDMTCASGMIDTQIFDNYKFWSGLLLEVNGDPTLACGTVTADFFLNGACTAGTFSGTSTAFVFVDGKLSTVGGVDKSCGEFTYTLIIAATCNSFALDITTQDFTWTNGFLTGVTTSVVTTYDTCSDCCGELVLDCLCNPGINLPLTIHLSVSSIEGIGCDCFPAPFVLPLIWDGSKYAGVQATSCDAGDFFVEFYVDGDNCGQIYFCCGTPVHCSGNFFTDSCSLITFTCDPFYMRWDVSGPEPNILNCCCLLTGTTRLELTE